MSIKVASLKDQSLLDHDRERGLIESWQIDGDRRALQELIVAHTRLVLSIVNRMSRDPQEREDLVSEAQIGLIRAANMFDLSRNLRFSTYARWWTRNHVAQARAQMRSVVDQPKQRQDQAVAVVVTQDGADIDELEAPGKTPEEAAILNASKARVRDMILECLRGLTPADKAVVVARFLSVDAPCFDELARQMDLPAARLRQMERRALSRLKFELLQKGVTSSEASSWH